MGLEANALLRILSFAFFTCNVVGMSIEKMRRNDEMTNFGIFTQPIPMFFFEVQN